MNKNSIILFKITVSPMANYVSLGFKAKAFAFPGI
jgi:hypothetical protein